MTTSRREFIKNVVVGTAALPILNSVICPNSASAQGAKALSPTDPMALSMGYVEDHTTVDKSKYPKKAGPDSDKQFCKNCVLYITGDLSVDGRKGEFGKCGIFQAGLVAANGWCNSFVLKV